MAAASLPYGSGMRIEDGGNEDIATIKRFDLDRRSLDAREYCGKKRKEQRREELHGRKIS